jgi:glycerol-3-phosphate O-acyltransferase
VLPAEIRLSIRQVALHRSEDAAEQVAAPQQND